MEETIGQCTGLHDKNGKEIYRGDIIKYKNKDNAKLNEKIIYCKGTVIYNCKTGSYAVEGIDEAGAKSYDYFPIKDCEIVGNIYDNPELVKEREYGRKIFISLYNI